MRSREYDLDFRDRASRIRAWGVGLLALAALLWTWCAVLLLFPYQVDEEPGDRYPRECESRLLTERGTANEGLQNGDWCQNERDWPEALAVLGLSTPVSAMRRGTVHERQPEQTHERPRRGDARTGQDRRLAEGIASAVGRTCNSALNGAFARGGLSAGSGCASGSPTDSPSPRRACRGTCGRSRLRGVRTPAR